MRRTASGDAGQRGRQLLGGRRTVNCAISSLEQESDNETAAALDSAQPKKWLAKKGCDSRGQLTADG